MVPHAGNIFGFMTFTIKNPRSVLILQAVYTGYYKNNRYLQRTTSKSHLLRAFATRMRSTKRSGKSHHPLTQVSYPNRPTIYLAFSCLLKLRQCQFQVKYRLSMLKVAVKIAQLFYSNMLRLPLLKMTKRVITQLLQPNWLKCRR